MLAGRKLLLADDSITIQKVVDLTFADEGVKVICFGNGREAVERLEEIAPDIVLADVFMPHMSGYEVCEYIKQNAQLKHIPVVLLVGSFEPFDEAEARRVGADEILTKPFQSIRRLIDRVGVLMGGERVAEAQTAELPKPESVDPEPGLSEKELEFTTADTQQFHTGRREPDDKVISPNVVAAEESADPAHMEASQKSVGASSASAETVDELLDLGDIGAIDDPISDEFVLDLDFDDVDESEYASSTTASVAPFLEPHILESENGSRHAVSNLDTSADTLEVVEAENEAFSDPMATTQEFPRPEHPFEVQEPQLQRVTDADDPESGEPAPQRQSAAVATSGQITLDQLAPEVIEAIARRAVEMLSEKVVQEIAWEVVPELSELLIKQQLEENKP